MCCPVMRFWRFRGFPTHNVSCSGARARPLFALTILGTLVLYALCTSSDTSPNTYSDSINHKDATSAPHQLPPTSQQSPSAPAWQQRRLRQQQPSPQPIYFLAIVAMFKNEAHIMREWLEHYLAQGVEHFVLINNNSTDPYAKALKPFISAGTVTLVSTNRTHYQRGALQKNMHKYLLHTSSWVLLVDLDEFMYAPQRNSTVASVLRHFESLPGNEDLGQVCVHWQMFGSSGYQHQPLCVVQSFVRRAELLWDMTKCAVKASHVKKLHLHRHVASGTCICADGSPELSNLPSLANCTRSAPSQDLLRLNHYALQAEDFFMAVKTTRGDATTSKFDHTRTAQYFKTYDADINAVEDRELALLQQEQRNATCTADARMTAPFGYNAAIDALTET